jgi:hypothetical protein
MVLMFLGMELILLLRVNLFMRTMPLIKWCGFCSTTVVEEYVEYILITILCSVVF